MGKDFNQHHFHSQGPNLNNVSFMADSSRCDFSPPYTNPYPSMVFPNGSIPGLSVGGLPQSKMSQVNKPNGWFYCLPRHRQTVTPMPNSVPKEFSASPYGHSGMTGYGGGAVPNSLPGSVKKRFLVFDQSCEQTNLFFSSAVSSQIQNPCYGSSKPFHSSGLHRKELATNRELITVGRVIPAQFEGSRETGDDSEMHEDTEELNALLYSEDESDTDDEETSTGHSPHDLTGCQNQEGVEESVEEVASSACPAKRKRVLDEEHYTSSSVGTGETNGSIQCKDDAELSCAEGSRTQREAGMLPANKRRREKVKETVRILQSIIPGGKGKDAILVLDEAIQYIKSLKLKVKSK